MMSPRQFSKHVDRRILSLPKRSSRSLVSTSHVSKSSDDYRSKRSSKKSSREHTEIDRDYDRHKQHINNERDYGDFKVDRRKVYHRNDSLNDDSSRKHRIHDRHQINDSYKRNVDELHDNAKYSRKSHDHFSDLTSTRNDKDRDIYGSLEPSRDRRKEKEHNRHKSSLDMSKHTDRSQNRSDKPINKSRNDKSMSSKLKEKINEILHTERHHIRSKEFGSSGDYVNVDWCPKYIRPDMNDHIPGGRAILHHTCRSCRTICLHLVGKYGSSNRKCLVCIAYEYGWDKKDVPEWYFHRHRCRFCRAQYT